MKAITLRNIPPGLVRLIQRRAREQRTSINRAVIEILEERSGKGRQKRETRYHDLDPLAGSWSKEEAAAFDRELRRLRLVDADLWT